MASLRASRWALIGALWLSAFGCAPIDLPTEPALLPGTAGRLAEPGPEAFERIDQTLESATGCTLAVSVFRPTGRRPEVLVVLAHGFMRDQSRMVGLAEHLASFGLWVTTVGFCNARWWDGHHDQNGADLVAVARALAAEGVIYAGFSAGGLAALFAAAEDEHALAYLGLDMVDHRGIGRELAVDLRLPALGLVAAPASCNGGGNGVAMLAPIDGARVLRVEGASHCHFELPMDARCTWVCGRGDGTRPRAGIQATIRALSTAALLGRVGADAGSLDAWPAGETERQLVASGWVTDVPPAGDGAR